MSSGGTVRPEQAPPPFEERKPGDLERQLEVIWKRNRFARITQVTPSSKKLLRRELNGYVGKTLSGRQWKKWAKQQRREEAAARRAS